MKLRIAVLVVLISFFLAAAANAEDVSKKEQDIRKLLDANGTVPVVIQSIDQMIEMQKKAMPQVPVQFWIEFKKELDGDVFVELLVPIYDKHFTHDEIKKMTKFFKSAVGKKIVAVQPALTSESMEAGAKWGEEISIKIAKRLREGGYLK